MPSSERLAARLSGYAGLVFDLDGTLVDSMHLHLAAWRHAAARHGFAFDYGTFHEWGGIPSRKVARMIGERQGLALDVEAVAATKAAHYQAHIGAVRPIAGTLAVVEAAHGRVPIAIATGTPRANLERILADTGLGRFFAATVCAEDVVNHKPHPDTFRVAAERMAVPAARCLAFEDTEIGLAAARAAGMDAVTVEDGEIRWDALRSGAPAA